MEVQVFVRSVYGNPVIYPSNPAAEALAAIAGTKTLSPAVLKHAEKLGCTVVQVSDPRLTLPR
jgi:hypothetical protein